MPKVELESLQTITGPSYPGKLADGFKKRAQKGVGSAVGLTQFGVNLVMLAPGALSSLRHWHENQDAFLVATAEELTLVHDNRTTVLAQGDCAAFQE